jgi:hypothetical protein
MLASARVIAAALAMASVSFAAVAQVVPPGAQIVPPSDQPGRERELSFPKIRSGRIRAVRENQSIIRCDACDHLPAWNIYRRSVQVAASA